MDEITTLHTLVERLAARIAGWFPVGSSDQSLPEVLVASVPVDFPASIPRPSDAVIIGAIRHRVRGSEPVQLIQLLFDTSLTAQELHTFYQDRLGEAGWSQIESRPQMGGFTPISSTLMHFETKIVQGESGIHLTVDVQPAPDGMAQVLTVAAVYPPSSPWMAMRTVQSLHHNLPFPHSLLPPLQLPPGTTTIHGGGVGSTSSRVESTMAIETDLDRETLAAFFPPQLEQAGWTLQNMGEDGALSWSTWAFVDEASAPWKGVLYVLRAPDQPRRYRLSLVGEWSDEQV